MWCPFRQCRVPAALAESPRRIGRGDRKIAEILSACLGFRWRLREVLSTCQISKLTTVGGLKGSCWSRKTVRDPTVCDEFALRRFQARTVFTPQSNQTSFAKGGFAIANFRIATFSRFLAFFNFGLDITFQTQYVSSTIRGIYPSLIGLRNGVTGLCHWR